jgi:5'-3' exonuclease
MDCNSIVYEAVHKLYENDNYNQYGDKFENDLIDHVIVNIEHYITTIQPTTSVYIAFDGVAPFAKMEQQRTRRYKTQYMTSILNSPTKWNTSAITPGTTFMNKLNDRLYHNFNSTELKFNVNKMTISGSDIPGEGEHKLFEHIRTNPNPNHNIAVYGLDADLIMLSLFNLKYCNNIFVFREAPEFLKNSLPISNSNPNDPHFLDMKLLSSSILNEMNCKFPDQQRIYDYVFLCLFLGNDFLPHFPAMNIRTHGIQTLLDIYTNCIGNKQNRYLISNDWTIQWRNLALFIGDVAKNEHTFLQNEYKLRRKYDKWNFTDYSNCDTDKKREDHISQIPIMYRSDEKYIHPSKYGWHNRYYKCLFGFKPNTTNINTVCKNYYEGLEWVFKYYSGRCPSWKWKYNYHYPPLFEDLYKNAPSIKFNGFFQQKHIGRPFTPFVQLSYVLPINAHHLLPTNISSCLKQYYANLYPNITDVSFKWAFCKYFWEAHPELPIIPIETLDRWNKQFE